MCGDLCGGWKAGAYQGNGDDKCLRQSGSGRAGEPHSQQGGETR